MVAASNLEFEYIQGFVLSPYKHLPVSCYVFLQMAESTSARSWLQEIVPQVLSAARWSSRADGTLIKPETVLNIAFTAPALDLLNIQAEGFLTEFREGIAPPTPGNPAQLPARSRRLGDTGPSDPANWEFGGVKNKPIHFMLLLFAADQPALKELVQRQRANWERFGLTQLAEEYSYRPAHGREPFGFKDGLSQPGLAGLNTKDEEMGAGAETIATGEFIQGYYNEYNYLPPVSSEPKLSRNGTYLVYRKLEQDITTFWNFVYAAAANDSKMADYIAAKFVGRWRSGAPLTLSPEHDNPALAADPKRNNTFKFVANDDKAGYGCPVGSHIRRTNPRDSLMPGTDESTTAVRRHRIIRRGRVYGPEYPEDVVEYLNRIKRQNSADKFVADTEQPRGIAFIAINTDIKRQFEFIQQTWVNDPKFDGLYDNKDPLLGSNEEGVSSTMTIQRKPLRTQIENLPRFVTVRAGGYFYMPGMSGLRFIAGLGS
ncbi:MAG: Dyp-type peroxidase [Chloroflexi bacterium]|uniref:Dyp-type peroxidase n=1 Tax=Candidatus Chlorohelix allophototropha TaxID=3003348 RepID=A0A8T7MAC4_9CHLR|nr:Dyp-type peroxidase [Chloroflexota bacterium]WJW68920.1 Dyp-type peroxidase [Chloroflexota bacterium L227-S17]